MVPLSGGGNRVNISLDLGGVPLLWMENEAISAGLHLHPRNLKRLWNWEEITTDKPTESLKGLFWWSLERIPLSRSTYNLKRPEETTSWPPHHGQGRLIVKDQLVHASVAFKADTYRPKANFSDFDMAWDTLVGRGQADDINWARGWRVRLEMDLFDPASAEDVGKKFVDAPEEERLQYLKRIPFLALSDNAVSSFVSAGAVEKLISLLQDSNAAAEQRALSSTCLTFMMKSNAGLRSQVWDPKADILTVLTTLILSATPKQQLAHLTLLAESPSFTDSWPTVADALLRLVTGGELRSDGPPVNSREASRFRRKWPKIVQPSRRAGSDRQLGLVAAGGTITASRDDRQRDPVDQQPAARCFASFSRSDSFDRVFGERYRDLLPILLRSVPGHALNIIGRLIPHGEVTEIIQKCVPGIIKLVEHDEDDVRRAATATLNQLAKRDIFQNSINMSLPEIAKYLKHAKRQPHIMTQFHA
ncbi:hypothetical protein B0H16DRAFT_596655 [Mycena metata]|uniref:Uncharacterized protein n=1 Tax=Mycena metata TaxID=1033252 RepID=A0AAD7H4D8_9AGAR|nr:hypothetical protein B0H16DRAFT_596655 [Mycena metata]